jgi:hypothetical protein
MKKTVYPWFIQRKEDLEIVCSVKVLGFNISTTGIDER